MDSNQAKKTLLELLDGGNLTATLVEADPELSANRELVSAATHEIAIDPDVIANKQTDLGAWFPYSFITRSS